jgi:hypothetical protein
MCPARGPQPSQAEGQGARGGGANPCLRPGRREVLDVRATPLLLCRVHCAYPCRAHPPPQSCRRLPLFKPPSSLKLQARGRECARHVPYIRTRGKQSPKAPMTRVLLQAAKMVGLRGQSARPTSAHPGVPFRPAEAEAGALRCRWTARAGARARAGRMLRPRAQSRGRRSTCGRAGPQASGPMQQRAV